VKTTALLCAAALAVSLPPAELATRYEAEQAVRVTTGWTLAMETTASEFLRDGEPIEGRGGFGGGGREETRRSVHVDRWLACADGRPTRVRRSWQEVEGDLEMDWGGESRGFALESPFEDVAVEVARDEDGELSWEVVEGSDPGQEALEPLRPELAVDALLPRGEVEQGETWDLEPEAIARTLGLDLADVLFQRPDPGDGGGGGRGGRGGRGGGMRGGGSTLGQLAGAEWSGQATYAGEVDYEGTRCALIEIELEAESESDGEGMTRSFEAELEGKLYVDLEARRPLALDVEGDLATEMDSERERQGVLIEMHRAEEGRFELAYRVEAASSEE
jgi:hypothetical protein